MTLTLSWLKQNKMQILVVDFIFYNYPTNEVNDFNLSDTVRKQRAIGSCLFLVDINV